MRRLPLALVLLLVAGCGGGGQLDAEALAKQAESIHSFAAEGALLARDVADGRSTAAFARVYAEELSTKASQVADDLAKARPAPGIADQLAETTRLARRVARLMAELEEAPGDSVGARTIQRRLELVAKHADELARA